MIRTLTCKTVHLEVEDSTTILQVKEQFLQKEGTPINIQRLVYAGKELKDEETLAYYNIHEDYTIRIILRLSANSPQ